MDSAHQLQVLLPTVKVKSEYVHILEADLEGPMGNIANMNNLCPLQAFTNETLKSVHLYSKS